jgi:pyruvate/2-oxoacid:ferredoxin oxidoreductase alpha subunit
VENSQEILDMMIQAYRIAEDRRVLLPVAICYEGMVISHFLEPTDVPSQEMVDEFLPPYRPEHVVLDTKRPMHVFIASDDYLPEYRYQQEEAMENAKTVIEEVDQEFKKKFNREYGGLVTGYMMEDAEVALISMGNISSVARMAVRELRKDGIKAGVCKMRVFRPFPKEAMCDALRNTKLAILMDRAVTSGFGGIVYPELAATLCQDGVNTYLQDCILGLSGRAVTVERLVALVKDSLTAHQQGNIKPIQWIDIRGL